MRRWRSAIDANSDLLIDTQVIVWLAADDGRLSPRFRECLRAGETELHVSAVTAFEFADLQRRRRIALVEPLDEIMERFGMTLLPIPAGAWKLAANLPDLHRDPVDRMLIAHALQEGLTLVTADKTIRRYPAPTLW